MDGPLVQISLQNVADAGSRTQDVEREPLIRDRQHQHAARLKQLFALDQKPQEVGRVLYYVRRHDIGVAVDRSDQFAKRLSTPDVIDLFDTIDARCDASIFDAQLIRRQVIENFDIITFRLREQRIKARPDLQTETSGIEQRQQGGFSVHSRIAR